MSAPFAQITQGPATTTGKNPNQQGLILDRLNNIVESVGDAGLAQAHQMAMLIKLPQTALTAITTAQNLFTLAFKAGALNKQSRMLKICGNGVYSSSTGNVATLTIALTLGGKAFATITTDASNTTASTNLPFSFEFYLLVAGTGTYATLEVGGAVDADLGTAIATAITRYLNVNVGTTEKITIGTQPSVGDTITINGTLITFIVNGGTPAGNQVALGSTAAQTATALYNFLAASNDANLVKATYTNPSGGVVLATSAVAGFTPTCSVSVPGNFTLANLAVDLTSALTLAMTLAASGSGLPSAQLRCATVEIIN